MQMMIQKCKKWTFSGTTSKQKELESCATSQIEGNLVATSDLSKFFKFGIGLLEILPSKVGYTVLQGCNRQDMDRIQIHRISTRQFFWFYGFVIRK